MEQTPSTLTGIGKEIFSLCYTQHELRTLCGVSVKVNLSDPLPTGLVRWIAQAFDDLNDPRYTQKLLVNPEIADPGSN